MKLNKEITEEQKAKLNDLISKSNARKKMLNKILNQLNEDIKASEEKRNNRGQ